MVKIFKMLCLSFLALTVAGCGKKVLVPEKTVMAAYIDLEKAYDNGKSVVSALINGLPPDKRPLAKERFQEALERIDKFKNALDPEWAVVTFGGNLKELAENTRHPENLIAVAIKVNAGEDAVKQVLKDVFNKGDVKSETESGHIVFGIEDDDGYLGLVDNKYIILSLSKDAFDDMFDLYAGTGKASDEFDDLSKISGNTICRISTPPIASLIKRFELTREIEKIGGVCEDEGLVDMILNMGPISLDVGVGDELGLALHVKCDSSSGAKTIESLMRSAAFLARLGWDACTLEAKNYARFNFLGRPFINLSIPAEAKDIFINLAQNVEAKRSWNVATLSVALKTVKLVDFIEKTSSEKQSSSLDEEDVHGEGDEDDDHDYEFPVFEDKFDADKGYQDPSTNMDHAAYGYTNIYPASSFYHRQIKNKKDDSSDSSYCRYIQKKTCMSNMRRLQNAAKKYMLNHGSMPSIYNLCGPGKYLRTEPICPKDGRSYRVFREDGEIKVTCPNANEDHKL